MATWPSDFTPRRNGDRKLKSPPEVVSGGLARCRWCSITARGDADQIRHRLTFWHQALVEDDEEVEVWALEPDPLPLEVEDDVEV